MYHNIRTGLKKIKYILERFFNSSNYDKVVRVMLFYRIYNLKIGIKIGINIDFIRRRGDWRGDIG